MKFYLICAICIGMTLFSYGQKHDQKLSMKYPVTAKVDTIDHYFGKAVADPYRWLENDTTKQTAEWVKAQNEITFGYLKNIPYRDKIKKRLETLFNYERLSAPFKEGDYYYFNKNNGLQNQSVLYRKRREWNTRNIS